MVDFEADIKACMHVLQQGGVILYPTDTIWGIGCDALNAQAVERIYEIKNRPKENSMIVLMGDARDIIHYVAAPPPDIIAIVEGFERPTTVIYRNAIELPANVVQNDNTIGIRVPNDAFCKALLKRFRRPIVSTSANLSGMPSPAFFNEIDLEIKQRVDYVVQYRQDDVTHKQPSRIVKMDDEGNLVIIRE